MASKSPEDLYEKDELSKGEEVHSRDSLDDQGVIELLEKSVDAMRVRCKGLSEDDAPSLLESELEFFKKIYIADNHVRKMVQKENHSCPVTRLDIQQQRVRLILLTMVQDLLSAVPREQPGADLSVLIEKLRVNISLLEVVNYDGIQMRGQTGQVRAEEKTLVQKFKSKFPLKDRKK
jgi:hypothetical protein